MRDRCYTLPAALALGEIADPQRAILAIKTIAGDFRAHYKAAGMDGPIIIWRCSMNEYAAIGIDPDVRGFECDRVCAAKVEHSHAASVMEMT